MRSRRRVASSGSKDRALHRQLSLNKRLPKTKTENVNEIMPAAHVERIESTEGFVSRVCDPVEGSVLSVIVSPGQSADPHTHAARGEKSR